MLYIEAERYLKNYDKVIRVDTTTTRYNRWPQVDAILPLKGKKEILQKLRNDKNVIIRRGYSENGVRFARISVICEVNKNGGIRNKWLDINCLKL